MQDDVPKPALQAITERQIEAVKGKRLTANTPDTLLNCADDADSRNTLSVRLVAPIPERGELDLFDKMVASGITERQAVLALLRRGAKQIDQLLNHTADERAKLNYIGQGQPIETHRVIARTSYGQLRQSIDPFNALTNRAFGLKVGTMLVALAATLQ